MNFVGVSKMVWVCGVSVFNWLLYIFEGFEDDLEMWKFIVVFVVVE